MASKPTIIFIHGAWHTASTWDKTVALLEPKGYKTIAVTLPSATTDPTKGVREDVEAAQDVIRSETTQGHDVVVVAHSYGGMIGASSVKGFTLPKENGTTKATNGDKTTGHVIGLFLISCGFVRSNTSFIDSIGGSFPSIWAVDKAGLITLDTSAQDLFYYDIPRDEADAWTAKLQKQSRISFAEGAEHVYNGWMDVPTWYLATATDRSFPLERQMWYTEWVKEMGADLTVREITSSHLPMLSRPEDTVNFLLEGFEAFAR